VDTPFTRPPGHRHTFTYTLNLTQCLSAGGATFNPNEARHLNFAGALPSPPGTGPINDAASNYTFKNQP
jgi:hypothetical protein